MFSELPKLFDRDFAVGFLFPAAVMTGAIWFVAGTFGVIASSLNLETLTASAIAGIVVLLIAVALLAFNGMILRMFEGYPWQDLLYTRNRIWRNRFHKDAAPLLRLQAEYTAGRDPILPLDFSARLRFAVENFPDAEEWVLPTRFGNVVRAFEVYSRVLYGMDQTPMWVRLQTVLPDQFRKQLGEAASMMNLFLNIGVGAVITFLLYSILAICYRHLPNGWVCMIAVLVFYVSYRASLMAAREYGTHVKSAFDLYRGDLAKQLGFQLPQSVQREREMWQALTQATIYRSEYYAGYLDQFRAPLQPGVLED